MGRTPAVPAVPVKRKEKAAAPNLSALHSQRNFSIRVHPEQALSLGALPRRGTASRNCKPITAIRRFTYIKYEERFKSLEMTTF
jgi:hypothetical protein